MKTQQAKIQLVPLIVTAIAVALITSALWTLFWTETRQNISQLNQQTERSYQDQSVALQQQVQHLQEQLNQQRELQQQQIQQRSAHEQELLKRYDEAIESKASLENDLAAANTKLAYLQENLNDYQMGDWERKYLEEKSSNDQIFENMARVQDEIELHKQIQEALVQDHQQELEAERRSHAEEIAALEAELATITKTNKKLQKRAQPVVKLENPVRTDNPTDYRSARVISLMSNIKNLPSDEKLNILTKVIPTVPEGITTNELTNLTSGMSSSDVLSLIKSTEQHIQKTTDKKSISLLLGKMNNSDADAAVKLLLN